MLCLLLECAAVKDGRMAEGEGLKGKQKNSKSERKENKREGGYLLWGNWEKLVVESISIWFKPQISSTNDLNNSSILELSQREREWETEWEIL